MRTGQSTTILKKKVENPTVNGIYLNNLPRRTKSKIPDEMNCSSVGSK